MDVHTAVHTLVVNAQIDAPCWQQCSLFLQEGDGRPSDQRLAQDVHAKRCIAASLHMLFMVLHTTVYSAQSMLVTKQRVPEVAMLRLLHAGDHSNGLSQLLGNATLLQNNTISMKDLMPGRYQLSTVCSTATSCKAAPSALHFVKHAAAQPLSEDQALEAASAPARVPYSAAADMAQSSSPAASQMASQEPGHSGGSFDEAGLDEMKGHSALLPRVQVSNAVFQVKEEVGVDSRACAIMDGDQGGYGGAKGWVQGGLLLCLLACHVSIAMLT